MNNNNKELSNYHRFMGTWSAGHLLKQHSLEEEGVWEVTGEDPNCDIGGSHISPRLGTFSGKLDDIIRYAVDLPGFWQWGSGGSFRKIQVKALDSEAIRKEAELRARKRELEAELEAINQKLKQ